jgi:hypothetical protein
MQERVETQETKLLRPTAGTAIIKLGSQLGKIDNVREIRKYILNWRK